MARGGVGVPEVDGVRVPARLVLDDRRDVARVLRADVDALRPQDLDRLVDPVRDLPARALHRRGTARPVAGVPAATAVAGVPTPGAAVPGGEGVARPRHAR